jgi:hypothetical protein
MAPVHRFVFWANRAVLINHWKQQGLTSAAQAEIQPLQFGCCVAVQIHVFARQCGVVGYKHGSLSASGAQSLIETNCKAQDRLRFASELLLR